MHNKAYYIIQKKHLVEDKRKVLTAAIVGSLGCGVLFVVALGCTRRLFHVQLVCKVWSFTSH